MMKAWSGTAWALTVFAAIAAAINAPVFAARTASLPSVPSCLFSLAADAAQCARLGSIGRPHRRSWISAATGKTLLYASEPFSSAVSISTIGANALTPSGELTFNGELPLYLTVDSSRNLYVAVLNQSGPQSVEVFPRGSTKPSRTYTDGISGPLGVAVDRQGTLYVANLVKSSSCNVLEYAKGSMKPTTVITDVPGCPNGVAVDSSSNLYVTYVHNLPNGTWQTGVMKYARDSSKGTALSLKGPGLNDFYGIAIDTKGNLVIANSKQAGMLSQILIFPRGSHTAASSVQYGGNWFPLYFALDGDRLFAPAYLEQGTSSLFTTGDEPAEFEYPSGRERIVESPKLAAPGFYFGFAISS